EPGAPQAIGTLAPRRGKTKGRNDILTARGAVADVLPHALAPRLARVLLPTRFCPSLALHGTVRWPPTARTPSAAPRPAANRPAHPHPAESAAGRSAVLAEAAATPPRPARRRARGGCASMPPEPRPASYPLAHIVTRPGPASPRRGTEKAPAAIPRTS